MTDIDIDSPSPTSLASRTTEPDFKIDHPRILFLFWHFPWKPKPRFACARQWSICSCAKLYKAQCTPAEWNEKVECVVWIWLKCAHAPSHFWYIYFFSVNIRGNRSCVFLPLFIFPLPLFKGSDFSPCLISDDIGLSVGEKLLSNIFASPPSTPVKNSITSH